MPAKIVEDKPRITSLCPTCNGCGRVPASKQLVITLRVMTAEWMRTSDIRAGLLELRERVRPNTLAERLRRMHALGLVERRPSPDSGRRLEFEWRAWQEVA